MGMLALLFYYYCLKPRSMEWRDALTNFILLGINT